MTAASNLVGLANGDPPRSHIEVELKQELRARGHLECQIAWVRSHIGIPGNEVADAAANRCSHLGQVRGSPSRATEGGIRQINRDTRKAWRHIVGLGQGNRTAWSRQALSAYIWMRTNKGPQRSWLHRIDKAETKACDCGHPEQDGTHITFFCHIHDQDRTRLIGARTEDTWEALDLPIDIRDENSGRQEYFDGVEAFFQYFFAHLN